jgi:hypothetical protein
LFVCAVIVFDGEMLLELGGIEREEGEGGEREEWGLRVSVSDCRKAGAKKRELTPMTRGSPNQD